MTAIELVAAVARGDVTEWSAQYGPDEADFLAAAVQHNVASLVMWRLQEAGTLASWPEAIRTRLERLARHDVLNEVGCLLALRNALEALDRAGIPCLLLKGAGLSYSVYPEPWLRPRNDNDLLVAPADAERAGRVLTDLGYRGLQVLQGDNESPFVMSGGAGLPQVIDLHWKISNRPVVADLLTFEELQAQSVPVPALGERARRLGDVHALILACVHMAAHHRNLEHLLWCYDLHLLACRLDADGFADLVTLARDREVAVICRINLERAVARFRTVVPPGTIARLETTGERSALLLDAAAWYGDVRLTDLRLLPTWRAKFQMIRDVALPSADYMLKEYDAPSRLLLPALHVYRLTRGTWRLLRRFAQA